MKFTIEIPDEEIKECVKENVAEILLNDNSWRGDRRAFRHEFSDIIKEMIYKPEIKNDIIDRTVSMAAEEIRRKGMPKLMKEIMGVK